MNAQVRELREANAKLSVATNLEAKMHADAEAKCGKLRDRLAELQRRWDARADDGAPLKAALAAVQKDREGLKAEVEQLHRELDRWKRGDLTAAEFDDFCHRDPKPLDAATFARSCSAYQRKLFGCAPHEDEIAKLRTENAELIRVAARYG